LESVEIQKMKITMKLRFQSHAEQGLLLGIHRYFFRSIAGKAVEVALVVAN
jgi:hypothetical protein